MSELTMLKEHSGMNLLRVIAAFLVVFIHVSPEAFSVMSNHWFGINIAASASRISVPLFFMLSGYFAFSNSSKNKSLSDFLIKKTHRLLVPLIAWSIFYIFYNKTEINYKTLFELFTTVPAHYHLWFFYTLIPMVLLTPFLSYIVDNINKNHMTYFILLWAFLSLTPSFIQALIYFTNLENPVMKVGKAQLFISMLGYYLLGAFFKKINTQINNIALFTSFVSSTLITILSTYLLSRTLGYPSQGFFVYYSPLIAIASISIFLLFTKLEIKNLKTSLLIKKISALTLGVYLSHPIIIDYLKPIILKSDTAVSLIFITFLVFLISAVITLFLSKVPLIKNIV
ncbi:acyltransferase [Serratia fonticola]|uniref:acyltransferase n=1 Tax=Serratia fonticola TaxID=47917 RepID=UPI00141A0E83|nr:acyltransferase family protein [Serratia fonticola]